MSVGRCGTVAIVLALATADAAAQRGAGRRDSLTTEISGFNVVLVVGETQRGRSSVDNLPEPAARALKDMGSFLPYKSYRVLDSQWMSCCSPSVATTVSGRLQGSVELVGSKGSPVHSLQHYSFSIVATSSPVNIPVRFILGPAGGSGRRLQGASAREMERERQDVQAEIETSKVRLEETRRRVEVGTATAIELRPLQDRIASLERRLTDLTADAESTAVEGRSIIDSSFTMAPGETVVVGTSKLGGDKALIALVTAVRKGGPRE